MNINASYHTQQCHTPNTGHVHTSQMSGAGSVTRLAVLALATQSKFGCYIRPCDIICENLLMSVTFYSMDVFFRHESSFMQV